MEDQQIVFTPSQLQVRLQQLDQIKRVCKRTRKPQSLTLFNCVMTGFVSIVFFWVAYNFIIPANQYVSRLLEKLILGFLFSVAGGVSYFQMIKPFQWCDALDDLLVNYSPVNPKLFKAMQYLCREAERKDMLLKAVVEWEEMERQAVVELMSSLPESITLQKFLSRSL